jgi:hypothetical protein
MKPVFQTIVDKDKGNCFAACLASVLEIPLEIVPNFLELYGMTNMRKEADKWLNERYGLTLLAVETTDHRSHFRPIIPNTICLASGKSKTFEGGYHVVVGKIDKHGLNFMMTHDPNPNQKGIDGKPIYLYFFVRSDPKSGV